MIRTRSLVETQITSTQQATSLYQSSAHPHNRSIWLKCLDLGSAVRFGRKTFSFTVVLIPQTSQQLTFGDTPIPVFVCILLVLQHIFGSWQLSRSPWREANRESGASAPPLPDGQTEAAAGARSVRGHPRPVIILNVLRGVSRPGGRQASAATSVHHH